MLNIVEESGKGADQTAQICRLISLFVRIWYKQILSKRGTFMSH